MLIALLLINAFVVHYFFIDRSVSSLNPFDSNGEGTVYKPFKPPTDAEKIDSPVKDGQTVDKPVEEQKPEGEKPLDPV